MDLLLSCRTGLAREDIEPMDFIHAQGTQNLAGPLSALGFCQSGLAWAGGSRSCEMCRARQGNTELFIHFYTGCKYRLPCRTSYGAS